MVIPARVDQLFHSVSHRNFQKFTTESYYKPKFFSNGTVISNQNGPTEKAVHLERWSFFSENSAVGLQNRSIQFWTGISGKFG